MPKILILKVAQREYIETVKTKTFLFGILFTPLLIVGIIFFSNKIASNRGGAHPSVEVAVEHVEVSSAEDEQQVRNETQTITKMMIPFFFMFLMYMGIVGIGQQMLSSVIEEKNSRVIEVLLSALSPFQLMAGKILGLVAIGLTVMSLWAAAAYGAASWQGFKIEISLGLLFYFVVYYILGFLLFSAILAAIGSICNTFKESQSLMMPLVLIIVIPIISAQKLIQNPDGTLAQVLSFVPPVTPLVMILRISAGHDIPFLEILASILLLIVAVFVAIWLASKVFRTGILMYGKRPSLGEISRWLRQS